MEPTGLLTDKELETLRQTDTPTVCNVIELFNVRPRDDGYVDGSIHSVFPNMPPIVGYASTATISCSAPSGDVREYAGFEQQVAQLESDPHPAIVVIENLDDKVVAAAFGEFMCRSYKTFGAVGLVTNGAGRDISQISALSFPVFASAVVASHGYNRVVDVNVTVRVGGLEVRPGDIIHADGNGLTVIPTQIAHDVVRLCAGFTAAEQHLVDFALTGRADRTALAAARARFTADVEKLQAQALETLREKADSSNGAHDATSVMPPATSTAGNQSIGREP